MGPGNRPDPIYIYYIEKNIYIYIFKIQSNETHHFSFSMILLSRATFQNRPSRAAKYALFSERVAAELPEVGMVDQLIHWLVTNQMEIWSMKFPGSLNRW